MISQVSVRDFEALVDSSLRIADPHPTNFDDQSLHGELWLMRACRWVYRPFRFRLAYHVLRGTLQIVYFQAQRFGGRWRSVRTTEDYRALLREADMARKASP